MTTAPRINGARLWETLNTFAGFGQTAGGGVSRLTLSDEDQQGREQLRCWSDQAGFSCQVDEAGNMFILRRGRDSSLPPVLTGSHADSQPSGGNYDGIYGVLAGLEILRTLNDLHIETERDILLVNWTNEEGARFSPAMLGSGVWCGIYSTDYARSRTDSLGITFGEALDRSGWRGDLPAKSRPLHACYELHIEQGPVLEVEQCDIGIVHAAMGQRWFSVTISGFSAHAGTTPMELRQDAVTGFAELVLAVEHIGISSSPDGRATVGRARIVPDSPNVVAGQVLCSVELRHPELDTLNLMEQKLQQAVNNLSQRRLTAEIEKLSDYPPVHFDSGCITMVEQAAEALGYSSRPMVSGAGHDACFVNRVAPTSMIFIPCVKGISHNEAEAITPEWATKGANVLLHTVLRSANQ
ncbi:Zn-dependent hydrolase [Tatumella sp. UBA2305]|uniref:Zn-dependent hydrolase n=1 Tax=Tatumella sp. UBA2305 TaxID=1947647 RepID=UPI0025F02018|nr:Zn-dependent hydrolase [Tatumella sp. UBA2305]